MPAIAEIISLDESSFDAASFLLARAFQDDPLHTNACPDPVARARWLPHYFASFIWKSHLNGLLLGTTGQLGGVAAAIQPGGVGATDEDRSRYCDLRGREAIGKEAWESNNSAFDRVFDAAEHALQRTLPEPHWYLDMLAVEPVFQGKGIGSALLTAINQRADSSGHPIALLTFQRDNLPFYTRHGYEIVLGEVDTGSVLPWWALRRRPTPRAIISY